MYSFFFASLCLRYGFLALTEPAKIKSPGNEKGQDLYPRHLSSQQLPRRDGLPKLLPLPQPEPSQEYSESATSINDPLIITIPSMAESEPSIKKAVLAAFPTKSPSPSPSKSPTSSPTPSTSPTPTPDLTLLVNNAYIISITLGPPIPLPAFSSTLNNLTDNYLHPLAHSPNSSQPLAVTFNDPFIWQDTTAPGLPHDTLIVAGLISAIGTHDLTWNISSIAFSAFATAMAQNNLSAAAVFEIYDMGNMSRALGEGYINMANMTLPNTSSSPPASTNETLTFLLPAHISNPLHSQPTPNLTDLSIIYTPTTTSINPQSMLTALTSALQLTTQYWVQTNNSPVASTGQNPWSFQTHSPATEGNKTFSLILSLSEQAGAEIRWSTLSGIIQALRFNLAEKGYFMAGTVGVYNRTDGGRQIMSGVLGNGGNITTAPVIGEERFGDAVRGASSVAGSSGSGSVMAMMAMTTAGLVTAVPSAAGRLTTSSSLTLRTVTPAGAGKRAIPTSRGFGGGG